MGLDASSQPRVALLPDGSPTAGPMVLWFFSFHFCTDFPFLPTKYAGDEAGGISGCAKEDFSLFVM